MRGAAAAQQLGAKEPKAAAVGGQRSVMDSSFQAAGFTRTISHRGMVQSLGPVQIRQGALGCQHAGCNWRSDRPSAMYSHEEHCVRKPRWWIRGSSTDTAVKDLHWAAALAKPLPEDDEGDADYLPEAGDSAGDSASASFLGQVWEISVAPEVLSLSLVGRTVAFRWENVGWMLGNVMKMNTRGGKTTFDISYPDDANAIGRHELGLDAYVVGGAAGAETCPIGTWAVVTAKEGAPPA